MTLRPMMVNPSDGSTLCDIAAGSADDINEAVSAAEQAMQGEWGRATAAERGRALARIGQLVQQNAAHLAELEALDVGKPLTQAKADVAALARYMEFYAGAADKLHGDTSHRSYHSMELSDANHRTIHRRRIGSRQCLCIKTSRGCLSDSISFC